MKKSVLIILIFLMAILFSGCATSSVTTEEIIKIPIKAYNINTKSETKWKQKDIVIGEKLVLTKKDINHYNINYFKNDIINYDIIKSDKNNIVYKFPIKENCNLNSDILLLNPKFSKNKEIKIDFTCIVDRQKIYKTLYFSFNEKRNDFKIKICNTTINNTCSDFYLKPSKKIKGVSIYNNSRTFTIINQIDTKIDKKIKEVSAI